MLKNILLSLFVISIFALTALAQASTAKFNMTDGLVSEIRRQVSKNYDDPSNVNRVEELDHFFRGGEFSFEKNGDNFKFKLKGKLTKGQRAVDHCEGDLILEPASHLGWKVELDSCNW